MLTETEKAQEAAATEAGKQRLFGIYAAIGATTVLVFSSFHPLDLGLLAWFALVPWLAVALRETRRAAVVSSFATTFLYHVLGLSWIALAAPEAAVGWLITSFLEGFYSVAVVLSVRWMRGKTALPVSLLLPPLWVMGEHHRGAHLLAIKFPWLLMGQTQHARTTLIQIADVTSVYGLSFLVVLVNAFLVDCVLAYKERQAEGRDLDASDLKRLGKLALYPLALLVVANVYGFVRERQVAGAIFDGPKLLAVQCNFKQEVKESATAQEMSDTHFRLTRIRLAGVEEKDMPDAIVWSETVWFWPINPDYPDYIRFDQYVVQGERNRRPLNPICREYDQRLYDLCRSYKCDLLVGTLAWDPLEEFLLPSCKKHNSIAHLGRKPDGSIGYKARYDKINLVPATEGIPGKGTSYGNWFYTLVKSFVPQGFDALDPGEKPVVMELAGEKRWKLSPNICFEISFPELLRESVLAGADVLICPSNDAWFWFHTSSEQASAEIPLALDHARFRAIETRRGVARVVNRGITCFLDPLGNVTDEVEGPTPPGSPSATSSLNVTGSIFGAVKTSRLQTFYVQFGDVFAWLMWVASAALAVLSYRKRGEAPLSSGTKGPGST